MSNLGTRLAIYMYVGAWYPDERPGYEASYVGAWYPDEQPEYVGR